MIVYDKEGKAHEKESVDVRECVEQLGWSTTPPEKQKAKPWPKPKLKTEEKAK